MRLLLVSHPPLRDEMGAAQLAQSLAEALRRRGHEVVVWSPEPLPDAARWYDRWLHQRRRLESFLDREPPFDLLDVPPVSVSRRVAAAAPVLARSVQPDLRYFWCDLREELRWPLAPRGPLHAAHRLVLAAAIVRGWHRADGILALGRLERRWIARRFPWLAPRLGHYFAAPPPGDRSALAEVARRRRPPAGPGLRFLWIGRWSAHKGPRALVRFLAERGSTHPYDLFTVAGCGEIDSPRLPASLLASGRLRVIPSFSRPELPKLLADHDVGLFTSTAEGWGLSLCEMLESGMPVAATGAGAVTDLRPLVGDALLLFPPPASLAADTLPEVDLGAYLETTLWPRIALEYEDEVARLVTAARGRGVG